LNRASRAGRRELDDSKAVIEGEIGVEAEVFAFGNLGTMVEGRCYLSSYITGLSPSCDGSCAPASHVAYKEEGDQLVSCLDGVTINSNALALSRALTICSLQSEAASMAPWSIHSDTPAARSFAARSNTRS
jgi:hypothetical protein